jgi:hypothetical protein
LATGITTPVGGDSPMPTTAAEAEPEKTQPEKTQPEKAGAKSTDRREPVPAGPKSAARRGQPQPRRRG